MKMFIAIILLIIGVLALYGSTDVEPEYCSIIEIPIQAVGMTVFILSVMSYVWRTL